MRFADYLAAADERRISESILDQPKPDLDPEMWTLNSDGEYIPTVYASQKIDRVVQWAVAKFGITDPVVHITGSIGSNQFGKDSDIDIHFCSDTFKPDDVEQFNVGFRKAFADEFGQDRDSGYIGTHPIEVYFQENPFQDMMSVGCYDYLSRKWECGPEIKDTAFDPYSEYYEKDMKYVDSLVSDIRSQILDVYEKALVLRKTTDPDFTGKLFKKLLDSLDDAAKLFTAARNRRKALSSPKSKEQALKMRKDRKWHVADSAFKLLDRFGYLGILRVYTRLSEEAAGNEPDVETYVQTVISAVQDGLQNNKMITDAELAGVNDVCRRMMTEFGLDECDLDEGLGSFLGKAALAGVLAVPGAAMARSDTAIRAKPVGVRTAKSERKFGRLSESNMRNLLATIAYNETMLDWIKYRDDDEIVAVLNTVQNRAGGDPNYYAFVISERRQYFSAKHVRGGYDDATYRTYDPNDEAKAEGGALSRSQKECWRLCREYAQQMLDGKLKNVIGDRNMIGNRKKDTDKTAVGPGGWGRDCDLEIGGQQFGYKAEWDGYRRFDKHKPAELTHSAPAGAQPDYVVKSGDTLWRIAKDNNTTVQKLKKDNGLKSDKIAPGQKLKV